MAYSCIEPSPELFQKVIKRIHRERRFLLFKRALLVSIEMAIVVGTSGTVIYVSMQYRSQPQVNRLANSISVSGTVVSKNKTSIVVQTPIDRGSRVVRPYYINDIAIGQTINASGIINPDGSITAHSLQLRPTKFELTNQMK
jgi:hypothetical protein